MTDADIGFLSAADLLAQYRAKALSPVEVVGAVLRHIGRQEPTLNAMVLLTADSAMEDARRAEAAYAEGTARNLEGVPVTIKDLQQTKGVPTQMGSRMFEGHVPDVDTPCVSRLRDAGCIMLGKTTAPEFGWKGVSQSPLTGITHNPWRHGLSAGGSSSGAAAGVAAGYGPLHQGGDGAGSIRIPAHMCGVFGINATHGRVPCWPMSNNGLATHLGPISRTVTDSALMLEAMAGPHPWDGLAWAQFSYPFNWAGNPAVSIPCGFNPAGLPVGLQIVAPRFDDLGVLQASYAFEQARPWARRRPPIL